MKPSCAGNEASTQNSEQKLEQDVPGCQTANKVANQPPEIVSEKAAATAAKSLQPYLTLQPHRRQPTRVPRPWDSPGNNTGVGCHFPLQCMKVKSEREVAQSCLTLTDPMDCSLLGCSIRGIFQARVREWGAIAFSILSMLGKLIY